MIKITCKILILLLFNGCIQSSVFLGPAVTVASTGSVYQAGLSYASTKAIVKITGKTPAENVKSFLDNDLRQKKLFKRIIKNGYKS